MGWGLGGRGVFVLFRFVSLFLLLLLYDDDDDNE